MRPLVFLDERHCKISGFVKIVLISGEKVIVALKKRTLVIVGKELRMKFFSKEEIDLEGKVESLRYDD